MTKATKAIILITLLVIVHIPVVYFALSSLFPSTTLSTSYKRISKSKIQKSLVIVSDITSHFGNDIAMKLADVGYFVLAGVHSESERKAYTGYNAVKGGVSMSI